MVAEGPGCGMLTPGTSGSWPGGWACGRPSGSARTSSWSRARCAGSPRWPRWSPRTWCSRWARVSARSRWPCWRPAPGGWWPSRSTRCWRPSCPGRSPPARRDWPDRVAVVAADALRIDGPDLPAAPSVLVANLPYNVAVPVVLHLLAVLPSLRRGLVMVQAEVADRMCAAPGITGVRHAVGEAGLVRRGPPGRPGAAQRVLAGAERGFPAGRVHPAGSAGIPRRAARRCSRSSTRPSGSGARRCAPRCPAGLARRRRPNGCSGRPASIRAPAGNRSVSRSSRGWRRRAVGITGRTAYDLSHRDRCDRAGARQTQPPARGGSAAR